MGRIHGHSKKLLEEAIKKSWKEGNLRLWKRLKTILLYQKGFSPADICEAIDVGRRSIFYWVDRYKNFGIDGLQEREHPGRSKRLEEEQLERLAEILDSGPVAYGFSSGIWTCSRVGHVIQIEFGVSYHEDHVRKILHQLGFSVQRPIKKLAQADTKWKQKWLRHTYPGLKKTPKGGRGSVVSG